MYNEKLAVAIKSAGKVLREHKDTVYIPFGSEYSVLIKNLNSVRALVRVSIDGTPVDDSGNNEFIVNANSSIELERFVRNGNLESGNRFKFIERTSSVEQHRGIEIEDGLIRIEFQFEKVMLQAIDLPKPEPKVEHHHHHHYPQYPYYFTYTHIARDGWSSLPEITCDAANATPTLSTGVYRGSSAASGTLSAPVNSSVLSQNASFTSNDVGITVPGSVSSQKFFTVARFAVEEQKHVMVLKLLGETEQGKPVQKAVDVKHKPKCTTCGKVNKATAKFCTKCGTSLTLV